MIGNPDYITSKSIARLKQTAEFSRFLEWLESELKQIDIDTRRANDSNTPRLQGGAIALEELLKVISDAENLARRMQIAEEKKSSATAFKI